MRPRRAGADVAIKVQVEVRIERHVVAVYFDYVNLVISLRINHTARNEIFDQKIVRDDQPSPVAAQPEVMGPEVGPRSIASSTRGWSGWEMSKWTTLPALFERDEQSRAS